MIPPTPNVDTAYRHYAELLLRRHRLLCEGGDEGEELDGIEDELTAAWDGLDEGQRQSLNGIGSDLNWARRKGVPAPRARQAGEVSDAERAALAAAEAGGEPHAVLHLLRVCSPAMEVGDLAERRRRAYMLAGLPQVAAVFAGVGMGGATGRNEAKPDALGAAMPPVDAGAGR